MNATANLKVNDLITPKRGGKVYQVIKVYPVGYGRIDCEQYHISQTDHPINQRVIDPGTFKKSWKEA